jgi:S-methylmethionine-dependent homocysteine/selenocysteine methylase
VLSRPDTIKDVHASFFKVGCDVVETNTFGSTRVVLAEYELQDKTAELNIAAAPSRRKWRNSSLPRVTPALRRARWVRLPSCPLWTHHIRQPGGGI